MGCSMRTDTRFLVLPVLGSLLLVAGCIGDLDNLRALPGTGQDGSAPATQSDASGGGSTSDALADIAADGVVPVKDGSTDATSDRSAASPDLAADLLQVNGRDGNAPQPDGPAQADVGPTADAQPDAPADDTRVSPPDVGPDVERRDLPIADVPVVRQDVPRDVIVNCPALETPNGGVVSTPSLAYGGEATYSCLAGYTLTGGTTKRTCQTDGTWSGTAPTCNPVDCGSLPAPTNGSVAAPTTTYQSTATYTCSQGYAPSSSAVRTCQADGSWSGTAPACNLVDCGALPAPPNGSVATPTTTYQSTATYACAPGFDRSGEATRTCQANGTWSGSAPTCGCGGGRTVCSGSCVDLQTDMGHCGSCGASCSAPSPSTANQCAAGRCLITLASGLSKPHRLVVDGSSVYFTASNDGTVMKVPLGGGASTTLASGQNNPVGIAVDSTNVYWANQSSSGTINRVPIGGGAVSPIVTGQPNPVGLAVDGSSLYWTTSGSGSGEIRKAPLGGGTVTPLASGLSGLTVVAVRGTSVYFTASVADGAVYKAAIDGSGSTPLATGLSQPHGVAVDGSSVYWTNYGDGSIMKIAVGGAAQPTPLASGLGGPRSIAVDATSIYWTNFSAGTIMKASLSGSGATVIASGQNEPGHLVVDGTSVYWTNYAGSATGSGSLMKLTPK